MVMLLGVSLLVMEVKTQAMFWGWQRSVWWLCCYGVSLLGLWCVKNQASFCGGRGQSHGY